MTTPSKEALAASREALGIKKEYKGLDYYIKDQAIVIDRHFQGLRDALAQIVNDWESVPVDMQVPDEINVTEHWDAAKAALGIPDIFDNLAGREVTP